MCRGMPCGYGDALSFSNNSCRFYSFRNLLSCILGSALNFFFSLGKVLRILPNVSTNQTTIKVTFCIDGMVTRRGNCLTVPLSAGYSTTPSNPSPTYSVYAGHLPT